jgi:hypothetical protein
MYTIGIYGHGHIFDHVLKEIKEIGVAHLSYKPVCDDRFLVVHDYDLIYELSDDEVIEHIVLEMI